MVPRETVGFVSSRALMFLEIKSRETSGLEGKQTYWFPEGPYLKWQKQTNVLLYSARGHQLRNCIPVGMHLNLIGGT